MLYFFYQFAFVLGMVDFAEEGMQYGVAVQRVCVPYPLTENYVAAYAAMPCSANKGLQKSRADGRIPVFD